MVVTLPRESESHELARHGVAREEMRTSLRNLFADDSRLEQENRKRESMQIKRSDQTICLIEVPGG